MQLSPQIADQIVKYIYGYFDQFMDQVAKSGQLDVYSAQTLLPRMKQSANEILNELVRVHQYQPEIPFNAIRDKVYAYAQQYVVSYIQQRQGVSQNFMGNAGVPMSGISIGGGSVEGFGSMFGPSQPGQANIRIGEPETNIAPVQQTVQPNIPKSTGLTNVRFAKKDPACNFVSTEDKDATSFSSSYDALPIVDVSEKRMISRANDERDEYNYCRATSYIPEPCVRNVINNFVRSNANLCGPGKWIIDLDYHQFILEEIATHQGMPPIDLSSFDDNTSSNLSVDHRISQVIKSVSMMNHSAVVKMSKLIIFEFNEMLKQYARISARINEIVQIEELKDLNDLASLRLPGSNIMNHTAYERAVFHCFKTVMKGIITNKTLNGVYATGDIIPHLMASPKFVLRDKGVCERYMPYDDKHFIELVSNRYTAFANNRNVVITNFIPEGLVEAIANKAIFASEGNDNVIEHLMVNIWGMRAKTVVMKDQSTGNRLIVKTGATLDGEHFMYEDTSFNDEFGLR
jgi:hypothetical protein